MAQQLYNSLTRKVEALEPRTPGKVQMFVCGPTTYDLVHIGNARTFTVFDVVARWLRHTGLDVRYIQNITDIDDKIIRRAAEAGKDALEFSHHYDDEFRADMKSLGNDAVSEFARATDHIPEVITQVKALVAKKSVYKIEDDGWYFDLSTFPDYGKLSGRTGAAADDAVSRIDDSDKKRNAGDFCVWKLSKPGEPVWEDEELGAGRPGWHIEDTAITEHFFGPQYDLHGGGMDLKFPHHEAEIAQQEAASGLVPFVKYWMHAGFLQIDSQRMGKSVGNMMNLRDAVKRWSPAVLRFFFLSAHYRSPLDFSEKGLDGAQAAVSRIGELMYKKEGTVIPHENAMAAITAAMENDFNTPEAFAAIFELVKEANRAKGTVAPEFFTFVSDTFGIVPKEPAAVPTDVQTLVTQRQEARDAKDFTTSDTLRDQIAALGYTVDDTPYGPLIKKK